MANWTRWQTNAVAVLNVIVGLAVLSGTWLFYGARLLSPGNDPLSWVQPVLLVIGGLLAIASAPLLAARQSSGLELLKAAIAIVPIILAARLIVVVLRAPGYLIGAIRANSDQFSLGSIVERAADNPRSLLINLALIVAVIVITAISKVSKSGAARDVVDGAALPGARKEG